MSEPRPITDPAEANKAACKEQKMYYVNKHFLWHRQHEVKSLVCVDYDNLLAVNKYDREKQTLCWTVAGEGFDDEDISTVLVFSAFTSRPECSTKENINMANKSFQNVAELKKIFGKGSSKSQLHCGRS
jgi:hypothetical protein